LKSDQITKVAKINEKIYLYYHSLNIFCLKDEKEKEVLNFEDKTEVI